MRLSRCSGARKREQINPIQSFTVGRGSEGGVEGAPGQHSFFSPASPSFLNRHRRGTGLHPSQTAATTATTVAATTVTIHVKVTAATAAAVTLQ